LLLKLNHVPGGTKNELPQGTKEVPQKITIKRVGKVPQRATSPRKWPSTLGKHLFQIFLQP
jgi:hypothetical protein